MYVILFLVCQLIFGVEIGESLSKPPKLISLKNDDELAIAAQEPWKENFKDIVEDIIIFTNNITIFTKDWKNLDEATEGIKNELISKNSMDFTNFWENWPEEIKHTELDRYGNVINTNVDPCRSFVYKETDKSKIENEYINLQTILTKPLYMHKNYIVETLQSLNNQVTILKAILPFKLRNCNQLNCADERTWVLEKLKRSKMVLENLKEKVIHILEVLARVNYNIYKQKYAIRTELLTAKNKHMCCSMAKMTCMDVSTEIQKFEPLNIESLMVKYNFQPQIPPQDEQEENLEQPSPGYW